MMRAADVLAQSLVNNGVDRVFCVPGESYLSVIDAFYDYPAIEVIRVRHEGGGGFMAVADAKYTGNTGVEFVSRGPGATNASIGIHVAQQDAVPLVLFIGQVSSEDIGRHAFQEVNYFDMFKGMAKHVIEVTDADRLAGEVQRAFYIANSHTRGPVIVSLPENMLEDQTSNIALEQKPIAVSLPSRPEVKKLYQTIVDAERPLVIAGGQLGTESGKKLLREFAEKFDVPVAVAWRRQDLFDHLHPYFASHLAFNLPPIYRDTLNEADLILAVGTRMGDVTTQGFKIPGAQNTSQVLAHVYPDSEYLGKNFETDLAINADSAETLSSLLSLNENKSSLKKEKWVKRVNSLYTDRASWNGAYADDGVVFGNLISHLIPYIDDNAVTAMDAGNFATWVQRLFPYRTTNVQMASCSGAMGMGVPSAIASSLRDTNRQVVCFVGDGGFLMTGNEMILASEYNLPIKFIVSNNSSFGTIRLYQEKSHPDRTLATDLCNPDFVAVAEAYGIKGYRIEDDNQIASVIKAAFSLEGPCLIDVKTSLEYISAYTTISELREE